MTNTKDIIIKLKEVRERDGLSYSDIMKRMEENHEFVSKSTLSRVFAEGSEEVSFSYDGTIRPIANALLDIETIESDDDMNVQAMKSLLKYKIARIEELEKQIDKLQSALDKEKIKSHEKLDKERAQSRRSIEFLKEQISLKDKRMDQLLEAVFQKDVRHNELLDHIMNCPYRGNACKGKADGKD